MTHRKAEAVMARRYGADAWEWMPNWGKVRNRLSQRLYDRYHQRMLLVAMIVPAVVTSALVSVLAVIFRG